MDTLQDPGTRHLGREQTAKLHVSAEIAELVRIYCVFNNKKMVDFTTEILERELQSFRKQLEVMRQLKTSS